MHFRAVCECYIWKSLAIMIKRPVNRFVSAAVAIQRIRHSKLGRELVENVMKSYSVHVKMFVYIFEERKKCKNSPYCQIVSSVESPA